MSGKNDLLGSVAGQVLAADAPVKVPGPVAYRGGGYMRGGRSVALNGWHPALREAQDDVATAWEKAAARATDAIINSGWLSGAIEQCVGNVVGTGLRLKAQPENQIFGMSDLEAQKWAKMVEQRWEVWSGRPYECDLEGRRTFGHIQDAAFRGWLATGEILSEVVWRNRPGAETGTKVRLLPAHRLSRVTDDLRGIKTGVVVDGDGMPIAYVAHTRSPWGVDTERRVPARDRLGRLLVGHFHDGPIGAYRGIGPLVPVLQTVRQFDDLSDATLAGQILKTLWAATIESESPTQEALAGFFTPQEAATMGAHGESLLEAFLDMTAGYYDGSPINVGRNGRVGHLFPGDKFELQTAGAPGSDYQAYSSDLKREIARALGMTYESFTGDYTDASYNSMAYGTTEIFEVTKSRRAKIVSPFCQMAYEAWLEEEIEAERVPFPGGIDAFVANRAAASRAVWRGAPKAQADLLKSAKAWEVLDRLGVISQGMIADSLGADIEDVYAARQQEAEMRRQYGLPEPSFMNAAGGGVAAKDAEDAPGDAETDGEGIA